MRKFKPFVIEIVAPDALYELRRRVLRGGDPQKSVVDRRDMEPTSLHLAGVVDGVVVAAGSFFPSAPPHEPHRPSVQLRYLATEFDYQGHGVGSLLLRGAESRLASDGVKHLWANARDSALGFYEREGWEIVPGSEHLSEETQLPHTVITKNLRNEEPFTVSLADANDTGALADLREEMYFSIALRQFDEEWISSSREYFARGFADGTVVAVVARTTGGVVVGSAAAQLRTMPPVPHFPRGSSAYIHSVSTLPTFRHRGVSRLLVNQLLRELRKRDVERVELHATAQGESLYRELGFTERRASPEMRRALNDPCE
jgi:GNAT superfamily N-acetyltransferase